MPDQRMPLAQIYQLYVGIETRAASALESLVGSNVFGELLATSASNAMALARIANGGVDRGVRALRVAGRGDVSNLARQLARTEDKLERMLQLVEELKDLLDQRASPVADAGAVHSTRTGVTARDPAAGRNGKLAKARMRSATATAGPLAR